MSIKHPYVVSVVSGLLLGSGFIFPALWFLGLFGVALLWWLTEQELSKRQMLIAILVAWFLKYLCSLAWYTSLYPLTWIEIKSPVIQIISIGFYWVTCALWLSFGAVLWYGVVRSVQGVPPWCRVPVVALGWLGAELGASLAFSVATFGAGGTVTTAFSFGMVGYLFGNTTIGVFLAAIGGVYGLSFLMVYTVGVVYFVQKENVRTNKKAIAVIVVPYVVCVAYWGYLASTITIVPFSQTVVTVNTEFTAVMHGTKKGDDFKIDALTKAIAAAQKGGADAIILPEESRYFLMIGDGVSYESGIKRYRFGAGTTTSIILDTGRTETPFGVVLRAYEYNPIYNQIKNTDKQYLVPQGEFMPWFYAAVYTVLGYGDLVQEIKKSGYRTGVFGLTTVPVMFCFESVDPQAARRIRTDSSSYIAHPLSHAWFNSPERLWQQLDVMLQLQARSAHISIISAANLAAGKRYTPEGHIDEGEIIASGKGWEVRRYVPQTN